MRIFTIGYEGATMDEFLSALKQAGVERVIDVRALPLSRRPGFSKTPLKNALEEAGVEYVHLKALGTPAEGRAAARAGRHSDLERVYAGQLELPEAMAQSGQMLDLAAEKPSALLCFERDPAHCHRTLLLNAVARGAEVVDLYAGSDNGLTRGTAALVAGLRCGSTQMRRRAMRKMGILLAGAIALAACSSNPPAAPPAPVDLNNPLLAPGFLAQAGSANEWEIESSQLALQMSTNPGVRNFANMIIADHTAMGQQVAAAATSAGLTPPPPTLLPQQQAMLDQLRAAGSGPSFDMAYQQAQIGAHQQAIQLMQNYAASGDVPALRTVASGAIPVMQKHLSMAQALVTAPPPPPPPPMTPPPPRRAGERG